MSLHEKILAARLLIRQTLLVHGKQTVVLWSGGKDSTVLLHLIKTELGRIPFPVVWGTSPIDEEETKELISTLATRWKLDIRKIPLFHPDEESRIRELSGTALNKEFDSAHRRSLARMQKAGVPAVIIGGRWNEHAYRNTALVLPQKKPARIYPLLPFDDGDIWTYLYAHAIPFVSTYKKGFRNLNPGSRSIQPSFLQCLLARLMHGYSFIRSRFISL